MTAQLPLVSEISNAHPLGCESYSPRGAGAASCPKRLPLRCYASSSRSACTAPSSAIAQCVQVVAP